MRIILVCFDSLGEHIFDRFLLMHPDSFIAKMANEGLRLINNYSTATFSHPSYPSILFGEHPFEHGILAGSGFKKIDTGEKHIFAELQELGWDCKLMSDQSWMFEGEYGYNLKSNKLHKKNNHFIFLNYWGTHYPYGNKENYNEFVEAMKNNDHGKESQFQRDNIKSQMTALHRYSKQLEKYHNENVKENVFIICSDHGEDFGIDQLPTHCGLPYRTMINTPLVVYPYGPIPHIAVTWSNVKIKDMILNLARGEQIIIKETKSYFVGGPPGLGYKGAIIQSCGVASGSGDYAVDVNGGRHLYGLSHDGVEYNKLWHDQEDIIFKKQYPFLFDKELNEEYLNRALESSLEGSQIYDKLKSLGYV